MTRPLSRSFYDRHVVEVARELLGKTLVREHSEGITAGCIVEVEAYLAREDPACHAAIGRTRRNASMFGPAGYAYVYAIHSRHCLNAVTDERDVPSAVLIRAVEPLEGVALMQRRRGRDKLLELARGPGRLCEAFAIDRELDGADLTSRGPLWIGSGPRVVAQRDVGRSPRIGVTSAHDLPLRFFLDGCRFVSGPRHVHRRPVR